MDRILKLKSWKIFLILTIASTVGSITIEDLGLLNSLLSILGLIVLLLWPLTIGDQLYNLCPAKIKLNHTLFLLNSFIVLGTISVIKILYHEEGFTAEGFAAIPFFYFMYAYLHIHSFPVKVLKTLELGRKAHLSDYIGDFFLMLFWPIGIWFIQPRVNKVVGEIELKELINSIEKN